MPVWSQGIVLTIKEHKKRELIIIKTGILFFLLQNNRYYRSINEYEQASRKFHWKIDDIDWFLCKNVSWLMSSKHRLNKRYPNLSISHSYAKLNLILYLPGKFKLIQTNLCVYFWSKHTIATQSNKTFTTNFIHNFLFFSNTIFFFIHIQFTHTKHK